ncbi:ATP-binding cassette domain-containing protein [Actinomyces sp.]|uniref:AAA family ATPase n=1 Tax=Actinomyces sp. TaxID=29317 RepID=UPI0034C6659B
MWRQVGHLVETPFSYPDLTARQNIEAAARLHGADPEHAGRLTARMSEALALTGWLDVPVHRLSLGTRQKVGLVGALAHEPNVVVLDEPTNGLDPLAVVGFRDLLREVTGRGGAVLVTGHHVDKLTRIADRVDILHRGGSSTRSCPRNPAAPEAQTSRESSSTPS